MAHQRSPLAGGTDFTGVSLSDLLEHIRDWRRETQRTVDFLESALGVVESKAALLDGPEDIKRYIWIFINLLRRYVTEFDRLLEELPQGVTAAHVEAVTQLDRTSAAEEDLCITFKRHHIELGLKAEEMRPFVDNLYGETRGLLQDYRDLLNMASRLKALVGTSPLLKVKPEFHGFSVDLAGVWRRVLRWFRSRKP